MTDGTDTPPDGSGAAGHTPVLLGEVLRLLEPQPGQVCLDCTLGRGGHAEAIAARLKPSGLLIGLDTDPGNVRVAEARLEGGDTPVRCVHANFREAAGVVASFGKDGVDLLIADLGFASTQMDDPARGLSFREDGPLDMRLDPTRGQTAADLVNTLPEGELADLIYELGEERLSRKIAALIVERRAENPITTTTELAGLVRKAYARGRRGKAGRRTRLRIDPATRTFMALRIAVNDELGALRDLLDAIPGVLKPGGTAAVISFHSLEDRLVKRAFAAAGRGGGYGVLTLKPVTAGKAERASNPRSRSAKLRAIRRDHADGGGE